MKTTRIVVALALALVLAAAPVALAKNNSTGNADRKAAQVQRKTARNAEKQTRAQDRAADKAGRATQKAADTADREAAKEARRGAEASGALDASQTAETTETLKPLGVRNALTRIGVNMAKAVTRDIPRGLTSVWQKFTSWLGTGAQPDLDASSAPSVDPTDEAPPTVEPTSTTVPTTVATPPPPVGSPESLVP